MQALTHFLRQISLRSKLVALMGVLMMIGVAGIAYGVSGSLRLALLEQTDNDLKANSGTLAAVMVTALQNPDAANFSNFELNRYHGTLHDADGKLLLQIAPTRNSGIGSSLTEPVFQGDFPTIEEVLAHNGSTETLPDAVAPDGEWRVRYFARTNGTGYVTIALPLDTLRGTVDRATSLILSTGMIATLAVSMVAFGVTSRSFRPLARVERTAAAIAAGDLSRRVEEYPPETEVGRLSRSLNAMLAHIEHAFRARAASEDKMRRFVQDASHELRTPLVTIQGYSELYRHGGLSGPDQVATAMGRIEGEAKRMAQLVEDLLTLARLDEHRPMERQPVDLLVLADDAVEDARVNAPDRVVRLIGVDGGPPHSAPTSGDEARLRQVVANLMTNALRYTPPGSPLEIAVGTQEVIDGRSDAVLEVRDHGPGISEEEASRVFERFYRADSSRQRETGGTGLGLAIVAAIAAQHDGSVRLTETPGGGATMSIRLPLVPVPDPASLDTYAD